MEFIFFLGGVITGGVIISVFKKYQKTYGVIKVDHITKGCKLYITSQDLLNRSTKYAVFEIDHNADFSREEQSL